MKTAQKSLSLACTIIIIFCLSGCASLSQNSHRSSSSPISSTTESQHKSSSEPALSTSDNQAKSSSEQISSSAESQKAPSGASAEADEEIIYITPNRDLPNTPPETDNQAPTIAYKEPRSKQYESGKVLLTCVYIDGTTYEVDVNDTETKKQVLKYVDGMKASTYTVQNTPPGADKIIDVEIHRNDKMELYAFSGQIQDGNALGRDFSGSNANSWTIVDKDAFDYLAKLLSMK